MTATSTGASRQDSGNPPAAVAEVFDACPPATRRSLLRLRALILETAHSNPEIGPLVETLKWGQASYLPAWLRTGTTVRIDRLKNGPMDFAVFFHCQTSLVV